MRERVERKLNDFLGKRVDLEDKPHGYREQLVIMDSRILSHIRFINSW